jgi:hypothetical protein
MLFQIEMGLVQDLARRETRPRDRGLAHCLRQIIKALLCLKYVLKEVLGGLAVTILAKPCEILVSREVSSRKVGSREVSFSQKNPFHVP